MVFNFDSSYSRESFEVFLDLIHNRISYPSVEKAGDVYDICNCLHCDSLCQLLNDDSSERVLSLLIQNQDQNDNIDFSKYERSITQNMEKYLKNPSFCLVSLPSLCRIFAHSNQTFSLSSLEQFLIGCMRHHGTGAQCILNKIKIQKPSDNSELNRFIKIMSLVDPNYIYDEATIVETNDQFICSSKMIQGKEYPFESDLFKGVLNGLFMIFGRNSVDVTASSYCCSNVPQNVLENDNSYWFCKDLPNSWIQFDFKQRMISLTSYSMNDEYRVKSWKVEGSINGSTFDIIDNKIESSDFMKSNCGFNDPSAQKNFSVQPNNNYYRYIRITSTCKNWWNNNHFALYHVEFFGFVL